MLWRKAAPPPPMDRGLAVRLFASVLGLGFVVMLFTLAIAAGDTSVGNSSEPWIAGDAVLLTVPVLVGACGYWLLRRVGAPRRRALLLSGAASVMLPVLLVGAFLGIAVASS